MSRALAIVVLPVLNAVVGSGVLLLALWAWDRLVPHDMVRRLPELGLVLVLPVAAGAFVFSLALVPILARWRCRLGNREARWRAICFGAGLGLANLYLSPLLFALVETGGRGPLLRLLPLPFWIAVGAPEVLLYAVGLGAGLALLDLRLLGPDPGGRPAPAPDTPSEAPG